MNQIIKTDLLKLSAKTHGILDYIVVAFLLASPKIFDLPALTSTTTYVLALIHFTLTVATDFPAGLIKIIPVKVHGIIELIVSITLVGVAFVLGNMEGAVARNFYLGFAAAVFVTWLVTDYRNSYANSKINDAIF